MASLDIRAIAAVTAVILLLTTPPNAYAAITCNGVTSDVAPCQPYARSGRGEPSEQCCSGISRLNSMATTEADRQAACNCLKNLAQGNNLNADVPYPISTSTNCSQVH